MACLKCGKKTKDEQVFCPACLGVMEAYPVKGDAPIQLPNRKEREFSKRTRKRRPLSEEEQLAVLKKRQKRLIAAVALLLLLLSGAVGLLIYDLITPDAPQWGIHYTSQTPTE